MLNEGDLLLGKHQFHTDFEGPLDDRGQRESKEALLNMINEPETVMYPGMFVIVHNDPIRDNNGIYELVNYEKRGIEDGWMFIGGKLKGEMKYATTFSDNITILVPVDETYTVKKNVSLNFGLWGEQTIYDDNTVEKVALTREYFGEEIVKENGSIKIRPYDPTTLTCVVSEGYGFETIDGLGQTKTIEISEIKFEKKNEDETVSEFENIFYVQLQPYVSGNFVTGTPGADGDNAVYLEVTPTTIDSLTVIDGNEGSTYPNKLYDLDDKSKERAVFTIKAYDGDKRVGFVNQVQTTCVSTPNDKQNIQCTFREDDGVENGLIVVSFSKIETGTTTGTNSHNKRYFPASNGSISVVTNVRVNRVKDGEEVEEIRVRQADISFSVDYSATFSSLKAYYDDINASVKNFESNLGALSKNVANLDINYENINLDVAAMKNVGVDNFLSEITDDTDFTDNTQWHIEKSDNVEIGFETKFGYDTIKFGKVKEGDEIVFTESRDYFQDPAPMDTDMLVVARIYSHSVDKLADNGCFQVKAQLYGGEENFYTTSENDANGDVCDIFANDHRWHCLKFKIKGGNEINPDDDNEKEPKDKRFIFTIIGKKDVDLYVASIELYVANSVTYTESYVDIQADKIESKVKKELPNDTTLISAITQKVTNDGALIDLKTQYDGLESDINILTEKVGDVEQAKIDLTTAIGEAEGKLSSLTEKNKEGTTIITSLENTVKDAKGAVDNYLRVNKDGIVNEVRQSFSSEIEDIKSRIDNFVEREEDGTIRGTIKLTTDNFVVNSDNLTLDKDKAVFKGDVIANRLILNRNNEDYDNVEVDQAWFQFQKVALSNGQEKVCPVLHWKYLDENGSVENGYLNLADIAVFGNGGNYNTNEWGKVIIGHLVPLPNYTGLTNAVSYTQYRLGNPNEDYDGYGNQEYNGCYFEGAYTNKDTAIENSDNIIEEGTTIYLTKKNELFKNRDGELSFKYDIEERLNFYGLSGGKWLDEYIGKKNPSIYGDREVTEITRMNSRDVTLCHFDAEKSITIDEELLLYLSVHLSDNAKSMADKHIHTFDGLTKEYLALLWLYDTVLTTYPSFHSLCNAGIIVFDEDFDLKEDIYESIRNGRWCWTKCVELNPHMVDDNGLQTNGIFDNSIDNPQY